jgi:predicted DCC family thiol-disulfide oxidoreductase YuxK
VVDRGDRLVVLFDEDCAFCRWTAGQLARLDRRRRLLLMPLQDAPGAPDLARIAATHALQKSLHVVSPNGSVRTGGDALIEIFRLLPGGRLVALWAALPGSRAVADVVYGAAARNRAALARLVQAAGGSCELPPGLARAAAGNTASGERYFGDRGGGRGGG